MAAETRERSDATANQAERATKSNIAELSAKVAQQGSELTWIRWALGAVALMLMVQFGIMLAIALQI